MSHNNRIILAIVAGVGAIALSGTCCLGVGAWTIWGERPIDKITAHPWWKKPPTEEQVKKIAAAIVAMNDGQYMWVSENGIISPSLPIESSRNLRFEATGIRRPDRKEAMSAILFALDEADFRDGPGR